MNLLLSIFDKIKAIFVMIIAYYKGKNDGKNDEKNKNKIYEAHKKLAIQQIQNEVSANVRQRMVNLTDRLRKKRGQVGQDKPE